MLDVETRRLYEAIMVQSEIPTLDSLFDFVSRRCKILENLGTTADKIDPSVKTTEKRGKEGQPGKSSLTVTSQLNYSKCAYCDHNHPLYCCSSFKQKLITYRKKFISNNGVCFICLRQGHQVKSCLSTHKCRICDGKHNTLLHVEEDKPTPSNNTKITTEKIQTSTESVEKQLAGSCSSFKFSGTVCTETTVVLGTAKIHVKDSLGGLQTLRVLLDSGSQVSAITSECVTRLGLKRTKSRIEVAGLSQQPVNKVKGIPQCQFIPHHTEESQFCTSNIIIFPQITTQLPGNRLPIAVRERYCHLVLADTEFDVPGPIEMLIGSDLYPNMIPSMADIIHSMGLPSAMNTHLGWVVMGALEESSTTPLVSLSVRPIPDIHGLLQKFWATEEPDQNDLPTTEDDQCEAWFQNSIKRDISGRFYVPLPFRSTVCAQTESLMTHKALTSGGKPTDLGSSRSLALNRLYNLERRLAKDSELQVAYCNFMDEYVALGHMRVASVPGKYFIPHHAVIKRDEKGMKVRFVFDASAKSTSGKSLNDCLCTGPKLHTEIGDVLLRNRFHKYIFVSDITKMYRQIRVCEEDCEYQHILWHRSPEDEVQEYELLTVTYGLNAAPFLALRCLRQLDSDDGAKFPRAKGLLIDNTYVDDIVTGADSEQYLLAVQRDLIRLLLSGGFELKKMG